MSIGFLGFRVSGLGRSAAFGRSCGEASTPEYRNLKPKLRFPFPNRKPFDLSVPPKQP